MCGHVHGHVYGQVYGQVYRKGDCDGDGGNLEMKCILRLHHINSETSHHCTLLHCTALHCTVQWHGMVIFICY